MRKIGEVRNNFGALYAKQEGEKFYMSIEDPEGFEWHEIPKSLYDELVKLEGGGMKEIELPAWHDAERLVIGGYAYDSIDKFVYDNEPAGGAEDYREDLQAALQEAYERGFRDGKAAEKSFMKNVKEIQGLI